jgi:hypothetical protein
MPTDYAVHDRLDLNSGRPETRSKMNPTATSNSTRIATKRVALFHALGLRCAGINGIPSDARACSLYV